MISTGTTIVGAVKTRQEILIFTDVGIQAMRFVGAPFVYSFSPVAENVSMISPKAGIAAADSVFFMDREGSMSIAVLYRDCLARCLTMCFPICNLSRDLKIFATTNPDDSEVTWYYPVGDASVDITNYVTYNYLEDNWAIGTLDRGCIYTRTNQRVSDCRV